MKIENLKSNNAYNVSLPYTFSCW